MLSAIANRVSLILGRRENAKKQPEARLVEPAVSQGGTSVQGWSISIDGPVFVGLVVRKEQSKTSEIKRETKRGLW